MSEDDAKRAELKRRKIARLNIYVGSILVVAIFLMVNYLGYRHHKRWDLTTEQLFSLSERSLEVARELDEEITVYLLLSKGDPSYRDLDELLERYRSVTDKLRIERVDPHREPARYRALADKLGLGANASRVAAILTLGDRKTTIDLYDLIRPRFGADDGGLIDIEAERSFTGAILDLTEGEPPRLCVTSGHGEWNADAVGGRGLASYREDLEHMNIQLETIEFVGNARVPARCSAVLVIGPERPFARNEVDALADYLEGGGNLLLALDPILEGGEVLHTGFERFLSSKGIEIDPTIVFELDPARLLSGSPVEQFLVTRYGDHASVEQFQLLEGPTIFHLARSVRVREGSGAEPLFLASEMSIAESDLSPLLEGRDYDHQRAPIQGSVVLGAALTLDLGDSREAGEKGEGAARGRLVVVGDADLFNEAFITQPTFANHHVTAALTGFLLERRSLAAIPPKTTQLAPILMTSEDMKSVSFRVLFLLPLAALLLAFSAYWGRRK